MQISTTVLNKMLNDVFNEAAKVYECYLTFSGGTESDREVIDFTNSSAANLQLTASVFFAITAGTTITGLRVEGATTGVYITETFAAPVVYTTNGTFTVNNITVSVAVTVQEGYYAINSRS